MINKTFFVLFIFLSFIHLTTSNEIQINDSFIQNGDKNKCHFTFNFNTKTLIFDGVEIPNYSKINDDDKTMNRPFYQFHQHIEKIIIKEGINSIGNNVFDYLYQLKMIEFEGIKYIDNCHISSFLQYQIDFIVVNNNYQSNSFCSLAIIKKNGECGKNCVYELQEINTNERKLNLYSPFGNK